MLVQRLDATLVKNDDFVNRLISESENNKGSCDEVWLSSKYGFASIETHREFAHELFVAADKFRKSGIKVSVQISNTIGHGEYIGAQDCSGLVFENSSVRHMVGSDGTVAKYCFCPNDSFFKQYVEAFVREYAKIMPECMWIDDDLRMRNHAPVAYGCFCKECVKKFNSKYKSGFTRESLVKEINFGNMEWRMRFIEFLQETLFDFTYMISKTVHDVSPNTVMGYQYCANGEYTGYGVEFVLSAMEKATGYIPKTRPGGGAYDDTDPNAFIDKAIFTNWQNYMLPDRITEKCSEIENIPDVQFGKSIAGTCFESTYYLANGNTSNSYAIMMRDFESMDWHAKMLSAFSKHRAYWEKLALYSSKTVQAGLVIAFSEKMYLSRTKEEFAWNKEPYKNGAEQLAACAIPVAYSHDKNGVFLLPYACAERMTDDELEKLFDKPVITDGETLELINRKGFQFGADSQKISTIHLLTCFTKHIINNGFENRKWGCGLKFTEGYQINDKDKSTIPLEYYISKTNPGENDGKISAALVKTPAGAKWAVFGYALWNRIISSNKRQQLINTAEYLKPGGFTAILETPMKAVILPRETDDKKLASVTITNLTVGKSEEATLRLRNPVGENFIFMSQYNGVCMLSYIKDKEDYIVKLPQIDAWSCATVFAEK